jgi:hypothetical protein
VKHRASFDVIGKVGGPDLMVIKGNKQLVDIPVNKLNGTYYGAIENIMEVR